MPRSVELEGNVLSFGSAGWSVDTVVMFDIVTQHPDRATELAEARVAYESDAGVRRATSINGWRADFAASRRKESNPSRRSSHEDPRIKYLGLRAILDEFSASPVMSEAPWLQSAIDLERVTGTTQKDFVFVAGINAMQKAVIEGREDGLEEIAAVTDILSSNPVDFFNPGARKITRDIRGLGISSDLFGYSARNWGPNIAKGRTFDMTTHQDEWVVLKSRVEAGQQSAPERLYPILQITSVVETAQYGEPRLNIPTFVLKQYEAARTE
jgi:hypothetical protein